MSSMNILALICLVFVVSCAQGNSVEPSDFSSTGLVHVSLAYASYCPFDVIKNWSCYWCHQSYAPKLQGVITAYNGTYDIFAFGGYESATKTIHITFRGTSVSSIKNWIKDFQAVKVTPYADQPQVQVHKGFYSGWLSVRPLVSSLLGRIQKQYPSSARIVVSGHSLGGAMATLAAIDIKRSGVSGVHLYTLGSPRVNIGDSDFYDYVSQLKMPSTRLVNNDDVVPHLPPQVLGYHHLATELWFTKNQFKQCSSSGEDPSCSDSVLPIFFSATDHVQYLNVNLLDGAPYKCDGVTDNHGPPGAQRRMADIAN